MKFFFVVFGRSRFDSGLDFLNSARDRVLVAHTVDDNGVLFRNFDLTRSAELIHRCLFEFKTEFFADNGTAGKNRDIFEHFFSSVAETGRFNRNAGKRASEFVHDKGRKRFALDILGDDNKFFARLNYLFEQGKNFLNVGDLLVGYENVCVVDNRFHFIGVGYHVRRDVSSV